MTKTFNLSEGERRLLLSADVGEGLFFAAQNHVALRIVSSPEEHALITSNPQEILDRQAVAPPRQPTPPPPSIIPTPPPTISVDDTQPMPAPPPVTAQQQ